MLARDGSAGSLRDVYFDDLTWAVRHLVVATGGWLTGRRVLIAPASVDRRTSGEGAVRLDLSRREVAYAPDAESDRPVVRQIALAHAIRLGYPYYWSGLGLWGAVGGGSRDEAERGAHALLARADPHLRSAAALLGCTVRAPRGVLGPLADFIIDSGTWTISSLVVDTRPWRPGGRVRLPPTMVEGIDPGARSVYLA